VTAPDWQRPSLKDWLLLAVGLAFVVAGLFILPRNRDVGIVTLAFFGLCTATFVSNIARKLQFRSLLPLRVEVAGGVPIRPSRAVFLALASGVFGVGATLVTFGRGYGAIFWSLAWLMLAAGAALLLGLAAGWLPVGYFQLDPPGITIGGRRWAYTVPWDCLQVSSGEFHDNPVVWMWIDRLEAVEAHPAESRDQVLEALASNTRWSGAHIVIMTSQYRMHLPLLVQALERYIADPGARSELARPKLSAGS
jgi:hypothetical protein